MIARQLLTGLIGGALLTLMGVGAAEAKVKWDYALYVGVTHPITVHLRQFADDDDAKASRESFQHRHGLYPGACALQSLGSNHGSLGPRGPQTTPMTAPWFRATRLLCLLALGVPFSATSFAQQPPLPNAQERRTIAAERLAPGESITLDGSFDEAVWQRAQVATDFIQIDPDNGQPATEQTEFRIAFDANAIYLGVICHDSEARRRLTR